MGIKRFTIEEFRATYPNEDACLDKIFELRFNNLICPKCDSDKKFTRVHNRRSYQCPACGFQVYPCKDTIFEKSTTPLTYWFYAIFLQTTTKNGVAAKELERTLNICYKTALRMYHQIKLLIADKHRKKQTTQTTDFMKGIVQIDESYFGMKLANKHAKKRKEQYEDGGTKHDNKTGVMGFINENKEIKFEVMTDIKTFAQRVRNHVSSDAIIVTDSHKGYHGLHIDFLKHEVLNHFENEFRRGQFTTNNIENAWSCLKRTIGGTHIHVSPKHLQKYVDEVAFRLMNRNKQDKMFETILSHVV
jgi:hypothetical protein